MLQECTITSTIASQIPDIPSTPFESIFADFIEEKGHHFLVVGDRLSGWVEAYSSPVGSSKAGFKDLIAHLHTMYVTFGVPEILPVTKDPNSWLQLLKTFLLAGASNTDNPQSISHNQMAKLRWL